MCYDTKLFFFRGKRLPIQIVQQLYCLSLKRKHFEGHEKVPAAPFYYYEKLQSFCCKDLIMGKYNKASQLQEALFINIEYAKLIENYSFGINAFTINH